MTITHRMSISTVAFLIGLGSSPVLAQTVNDNTSMVSTTAVTAPNATNDTLNSQAVDRIVDRDLAQERSIENGLNDGQLTTQEGASLERGEARIDQMESTDLSDGSLTAQEAARLRRAQADENNRITQLEDNGMTSTTAGTSNSQLSADVQRNINQQQRIDNGLANGSLTATEAGSLEGGQTSIADAEAKAGRNNIISASEQQTIRGDENAQSTDIRDDRHNGTTTTTVTGSMHDHDRDRGWGHWSWDRHNNDGNNTMMNANGNMASNDNAATTGGSISTSTGASASVNNGSSTSVTANGGSTVTPVSAPSMVMPPAPPVPPAPVHPAVVVHHK